MQNQSSNNKRIIKNTLMLYIRMGILILVNLYTSRIILNALERKILAFIRWLALSLYF